MKMIKAVALTLSMIFANLAFACPEEIHNDGGLGGGGISGVGGGGDGVSFAVWQYQNPIFQETFPQLLRLEKIDGNKVQACVYDKQFLQTDTPKLVATLSCEGGETIAWPYQDSLRVHCNGQIDSNSLLRFEATYLGGNLMGFLERREASGLKNTSAFLMGH